MTHDPMCPDAGEHFVSRDIDGNSMSCMCSEYARVRVDERERAAERVAAWGIGRFSEYVRFDMAAAARGGDA